MFRHTPHPWPDSTYLSRNPTCFIQWELQAKSSNSCRINLRALTQEISDRGRVAYTALLWR